MTEPNHSGFSSSPSAWSSFAGSLVMPEDFAPFLAPQASDGAIPSWLIGIRPLQTAPFLPPHAAVRVTLAMNFPSFSKSYPQGPSKASSPTLSHRAVVYLRWRSSVCCLQMPWSTSSLQPPTQPQRNILDAKTLCVSSVLGNPLSGRSCTCGLPFALTSVSSKSKIGNVLGPGVASFAKGGWRGRCLWSVLSAS